MSLDANYSNIEDYEDVCYVDSVIPASQGGDGIKTEKSLSGITQTIVFLGIVVGIREITEDNWFDYWARMSAYDGITGGSITCWGEDNNGPKYRSVAKEEVKQHIGLSTNVSEYTDSEFGEALGRVIKSNKRFAK